MNDFPGGVLLAAQFSFCMLQIYNIQVKSSSSVFFRERVRVRERVREQERQREWMCVP
jgi:hypothetical protein